MASAIPGGTNPSPPDGTPGLAPVSRTPTSPMLDGRSPRIHLALTIWTALLIGLVLVEIRRLPPGLTALLVPYLAVTAWLCLTRLRQREHAEPAMSLDDTAAS